MILKIQQIVIVLALFQNFPVAAGELSSGVSLNDIKNVYRSGQYVAAASSARKFLKIAPESEEAKDILAYSLFQAKDYRGVIGLYSDSQAEYIASPIQLKLRSISQAKEGNYYSAIVSYRNLREDEVLETKWKPYYHYLVFKINKESAFKELKKMNQVSPHISYNIISGDLYALSGNYDKAIESFELALKKDYLNIEAMEKLADNHSRKNQFDKAVVIYQSILKILPERFDIKLKMSWSLEKNGHYLEALNLLEDEKNPRVSDYKKKLSIRVQNFLNSNSSRALASSEVESPVDGRVNLEESFIPMPPLEISAEETPNLVVNIDKMKTFTEREERADKSILEFYLGPKAKKYDLTGIGFNAHVNYSSGLSTGIKYIFAPGDRPWETGITLNHSRTFLNNLRGLTPSDIRLVETKVGLNTIYKVNSFGLGPALMYERMSTTQTTPNSIRGDVNFFNLGIKGVFTHSFSDSVFTKVELNYFSKILANSNTTNVGSVNRRAILSTGMSFYYKVNSTINYFSGVTYVNTSSTYKASSLRGTIAAKEKEQDITFPIGINYVF